MRSSCSKFKDNGQICSSCLFCFVLFVLFVLFFTRFYLATVLIIPIIVKKRTKSCRVTQLTAPYIYIIDFIHHWIVIIKHFSQHTIDNNASDINHFSQLLMITIISPIVLSFGTPPSPPCSLHLYAHHVSTYKGVIDI